MKKINIGFIGCGRISDLHAPGYTDNPAARIYAVCDTNRELAERRQKEWNAARVYTDYREMLEDPKLDGVEILSPQLLHEPMAIHAAQAGKHIALQKPMTISLDSADRILNAVKDKELVFKVSDNYLFYPPIVMAKKMIDNGEIGTPSNLRIKMISSYSGGWEVPAASWEWRMEENAAGRGFQIFDHGHHLWTASWYLLGGIERVTSWIDTVDGIIDSPAVIMWKYQNGISYGTCEYAHASDLDIPSDYYSNDEWIEITGSRGVIIIHQCTGKINERPGLSVFNNKGWTHYPEVKTDWGEGFVGATHNFIDAVSGAAAPLLSGEEAREILKITLAITKSSRVRREVYVNEMDASFPWLYTLRKIRQDKKQKTPGKNIISLLGLGGKDARYAPRAGSLTRDLVNRFKPDEAGDWNITIGLQVTEEERVPEVCFGLAISEGKVVISEGALPPDPDLIMTVPAGTWAAILLGKKRIETALLQRKLKLEGQAEQGLKLRKVFGI